MLGLEGLHGHFQAQLGILGRRQLVLQLCHLCPEVTGRLFCHPAGSLQLMYLVGGRVSAKHWVTEWARALSLA